MTGALDVLSRTFREFQVRRLAGVYLLISNDEIVYVGQSLDMTARIASHVRSGAKGFDRVLWFETSVDDRLAYEGALIRLLRPFHNGGVCPAWVGRDNEILSALGLPVHADEKAHALEWERTRYRNPDDSRFGPRSEEYKAFMRRHREMRAMEKAS